MKKTLEPYQLIERSIIKKYRKELWTPFIVAVKRYELVQAGDRIAVCISGGKDSMLMAKLMRSCSATATCPLSWCFWSWTPATTRSIAKDRIQRRAAAHPGDHFREQHLFRGQQH